MENNTVVIGKISNTPRTIRNVETSDIIFSITESGTNSTVQIIAHGNDVSYKRIKSGDTVEIVGTAFTKKISINGNVKCVHAVRANSICIKTQED